MYAQENYTEQLGSGTDTTTIAAAGCYVTAFANLLHAFGVECDPESLNAFFIQHNCYIAESDGTKDLLSAGSITAYDANIRVVAQGNGVPTANNSIVKFVYGRGVTHFCLVQDYKQGLIVDSYDGKVKHWSVYGGPKSWAAYTNAAAQPTTTAKPLATETGYRVAVPVPGYYTSNDAANRQRQVDTVQTGDYYIFNQANGMVNVTLKPGVAGSWINPADNVEGAPAPTSVVVTAQPGWGLERVAEAAHTTLNPAVPATWQAIAAANGSDDWEAYNKALKPGQAVKVPLA